MFMTTAIRTSRWCATLALFVANVGRAEPSPSALKEGATARILQARNCQVILEGIRSSDSVPQGLAFIVYAKAKDDAALDQRAVLTPVSPQQAQAVEELQIFQVVQGSNCDGLVGMSAVLAPWQNDGSQPPPPLPPSPVPEPPLNETPTPSDPSPMAYPPTQDTVPEPKSSPHVELFGGLRFEQMTLSGLVVDNNRSVSFGLAGWILGLQWFPLSLGQNPEASQPAEDWTGSPFVSLSLQSSETLDATPIEASDATKGRAHSSRQVERLGVGYRFEYGQGLMLRTEASLHPWHRTRVQHQNRIKAAAAAFPQDLRDVSVSCVTLRLQQSWNMTQGTRAFAGLEGCLFDDSKTLPVSAATFPNSSTRFKETEQWGATLGASFALDESGALRLEPALSWQTWKGALGLDDGQTIDSDWTDLSIQALIHAAL
jgi:hypothetical protein